jgi:ABC-type branched-subunit amino acid transport system ATPase component
MDDGKKIAEGQAREVAADPAVITAYLGSREVGRAREAVP